MDTLTAPTMAEQAIAQYDVSEQVIARMQDEYLALSVKENGIATVSGARKEVKRLRVAVDKKREELKKDVLIVGRAIDAEAKRLTALLAPIERHLQDEEDIHNEHIAREKARIAAEKQQKIQDRIDALTAAGVTQVNLLAVQDLSDELFATMLQNETKAAEARRIEAERLETIRLEEQARQAEELRIRAEELEAQRQAMLEEQERQNAERARLEAIEAERRQREEEEQAAVRAEQQRILNEERAALQAERDRIAKEAAALKAAEDARKAEEERLAAIERKRIRDEEEAENLRQWNEEQARLRAEELARQEALKPEILKAETFCARLQAHAHEILEVLDVKWYADAMRCVERCCEDVTDLVAKQ